MAEYQLDDEWSCVEIWGFYFGDIPENLIETMKVEIAKVSQKIEELDGQKALQVFRDRILCVYTNIRNNDYYGIDKMSDEDTMKAFDFIAKKLCTH